MRFSIHDLSDFSFCFFPKLVLFAFIAPSFSQKLIKVCCPDKFGVNSNFKLYFGIKYCSRAAGRPCLSPTDALSALAGLPCA